MPNAEARRQFVHAGMALWIIALRWMTPLQAVLLAVAAVTLNWVILPLTGLDRSMRRDSSSFIDGVKLYPVAVLIVLLLFPLPVAAIGWAVLGIGDAASNLIGRRYGRGPFLGRPDRSWVGTLGFLATAAPAAFLAAYWVGGAHAAPANETGILVVAAGVSAVAGAVMEYVPWPRPLDDNLPIALAASTAAWLVLGA